MVAVSISASFLFVVYLENADDDFYIQRSLGVIASLFVILVIPEFWKNCSNKSMEIEAVSYFP